MKYDVAEITKMVSEAIAYSQQFATVDDGGTCNFDAAYICVPGMRKSVAAQIANVGLLDSRWHGRRLSIRGTLGQANRRTQMAKAQYDFLIVHYPQYQFGMYYQMD